MVKSVSADRGEVHFCGEDGQRPRYWVGNRRDEKGALQNRRAIIYGAALYLCVSVQLCEAS